MIIRTYVEGAGGDWHHAPSPGDLASGFGKGWFETNPYQHCAWFGCFVVMDGFRLRRSIFVMLFVDGLRGLG